MEQFQTDLNSERATLQKVESSKNTLEKQVGKLCSERFKNNIIKIGAVNYFLFIVIIQEFPPFFFCILAPIFPVFFANDTAPACLSQHHDNKPVPNLLFSYLLEQRHESQTTGTGEPDACSQQDDCTGTGE